MATILWPGEREHLKSVVVGCRRYVALVARLIVLACVSGGCQAHRLFPVFFFTMPAGYSSQPVSGFTGHIPGAKWQVGSRYVPPQQSRSDYSLAQTTSSETLKPLDQLHPMSHIQIHTPVDNMDDQQRDVQLMQQYHQQQQQRIPMSTASQVSFNDNYPQDHRMHDVSVGNNSILRPGSSEMSIGYNAQGMPIRYINNGYQQVVPNQMRGVPYPQDGYRMMRMDGNQMDQQAVNNQMSGQQNGQYLQEGYRVVGTEGNQMDQQSVGNQTRGGGGSYQQEGSRASRTEGTQVENQRSRPPIPPSEGSQRSRSLPRRRIEKDPFEGIEGGWWSKGEVLRNKERRELADRGRGVYGGGGGGGYSNYVNNPASYQEPGRAWQEREGETDDIPAAGYSGHIQGLRQIGIGKSFNTAAKEAKKEYVERRRARSGSRDHFLDQSRSNNY